MALPHLFGNECGFIKRDFLDDNFRAINPYVANVVAYGAVMNGVVDDTAAFLAAIATGLDVYVPDGPTLITATLTLPSGQRLLAGGRLSSINFAMAVNSPGIILLGSAGRQQVTGFTMSATNCPKVISVKSPQSQIFFNAITNLTNGGVTIYEEDENVPGNVYCFGTQICYNYLHGAFTVGSRGVRCGLNSQTTQIIGNVIDNFESGISVVRNTDSLLIEGNVLESLMSTGYGVDMRSDASSSVYKAVTIRGNHFEDVYGAVAWGTTGGSGATYTSCQIYGNEFSGHSGGTNYFLSVLATCGAGSTNNRVEYNDVSGNLTAFFNLIDSNGAASLTGTKGNTLAAGVFATGAFAINAYETREHNAYFGAVLTSGVFTSQSVTRQEVGNTSFKMFLRWNTHEFLETLQFQYLSIGATPNVILNLHRCVGNVDTIIATTGVVTANGTVTLTVNTVAIAGDHYYVEYLCTLAGGTTAYVYPLQMNLQQ